MRDVREAGGGGGGVLLYKGYIGMCRGMFFLMTNKSKGPRTKMLLVYVGATDSSNQPKIKFKDNKLQG